MADQAWPPIRLKFVTSQRRAPAEDLEEYVGLEHVDSWTGKLLDTVPSQAMTGDGIAAEPGDVLFGKLRPYLAKGWKADRPISCSPEFAVLRPKSRLDADFLRYVLLDKEFVDAMTALTYGTRMPRVSPDEIGNYAIATPDLPTQRAIAAFLDRETAKIDALIKKKRRLLDLLDEKRTALITRAVTRGLDPDMPMKDSGVEWLGEIPAQWDVTRLRRVAQVVDCKHRTPRYVPSGYPLVSTTEVKPGTLDLSLCTRFVSEADYLDMTEGRRHPQDGDIIYSRNASLGAAALVETDAPFCMGQDVVLIRGVPYAVDVTFLTLHLNSPIVTKQVEALGIGSTFSRINVSDIRDLLVTIPPVDEQEQIAGRLRSSTDRSERIAAGIHHAISLLQEYRAALISAAVTGQIDVPNAAA